MQKRKALGTRHLQGSRWHLMEARGLIEKGTVLFFELRAKLIAMPAVFTEDTALLQGAAAA